MRATFESIPRLMLIAIALAGCTRVERLGGVDLGMDEVTFAAFERIVVPIISERPRGVTQAGTAVVLGGSRLLTCRHVVPEHGFSKTYHLKGGRIEVEGLVRAEIGGRSVRYRVVASGERADDVAEDWALIEVLDEDGHRPVEFELPAGITVELDPHRVPAPGEPVILMGFLGFGIDSPPQDRLHPWILHSCPVDLDEVPLDVPDGVFYLRQESNKLLRGMSGGPAVIWEPDAGRAVVLGVLSGAKPLQRVWFIFSSRAGAALAVRRVPPPALEAVAGAGPSVRPTATAP